ncbi:MAG TPA: peptidylprolyl isomerase, partial [Longimicrobium sp.]|nr:peptidylprolyl isomerase [Longimicrobium sp.]
VTALTEQYRQQSGERITAEVQREIDQQAWDSLVEEILVQQELAKRDIRVTDEQLQFFALNVPIPQLAQQEIFQTNGQFDISKYRQYLSSPQASDELLAQVEQYHRGAIPQRLLMQQVTSGVYPSDAELWRLYRDQNETATVEYVQLDLAKLAPASEQVSNDEIRRYYNEHKDDFKRGRTARFTVAYLGTAPTDADRQAVMQRALQLRQQITSGGGDFATLARSESSDTSSGRQGGDLGTVRKGQMVAAFDSAVWALPVNEVSQPVRTQFGYHLVQVTERGADTARVRHILLPIQKSPETIEAIDAKGDTLGDLAESQGLERAARSVGATVRQGVAVSDDLAYIPGVGPAMEALNWAQGEAREMEPGDRPVSDVMEGQDALYVVRLESYAPKGTMTLAEATPQIRERLILEKKRQRARAEGEKIVSEVRGGSTLQQAAARRGLSVLTAGPFSRGAPNPALGQASAAVGAAFGVPLNQVSGVVETEAGLYIVRPTQRTGADQARFNAEKGMMRNAIVMQLRQRVGQQWLASLKKSADIEDNRDEIFGG